MTTYKPGIYRWRRVPEDDRLGRVHTDFVRILDDCEAADFARRDGAHYAVETNSGKVVFAPMKEITGPFDDQGNLL
jgi:hypothetical protein